MDDNHERLEAAAERVERIRDYVPAEEFDKETARSIAHAELAPFYESTPIPK